MRICILKSTGKLIESQSVGDSPPINPEWTSAELEAETAAYRAKNLQTLIDNAVRQGHKVEDIEAKFIPDADLPALIEFSKTPEQIAAEQAAEAARIAKAQAFINNLPSWLIVETAVNNIANLSAAKAFLLKLARVTYWLAKNRAD